MATAELAALGEIGKMCNSDKHEYWQAFEWLADNKQMQVEGAFGWADAHESDVMNNIMNGRGTDSIRLAE